MQYTHMSEASLQTSTHSIRIYVIAKGWHLEALTQHDLVQVVYGMWHVHVAALLMLMRYLHIQLFLS